MKPRPAFLIALILAELTAQGIWLTLSHENKTDPLAGARMEFRSRPEALLR